MKQSEMSAANDPNDAMAESGCVMHTPMLSALRSATVTVMVALMAFAACFAGTTQAVDLDAGALAERYQLMHSRIAASPFDRPLVVDSGDDDGRIHGEIHGELDQPFARLAAGLKSSDEWCAVIALHINVKGCAYEHTKEGDFLTAYSGRKLYEAIEPARAIRYAFRVRTVRSDYLRVVLAAPTGPLGTREYEFVFEAMPIGGHTFVGLSYSFRASAASRFAMLAYLATAGSGKSGFTIVGRSSDGQPKAIGGLRGIVERNAMRTFLALEAWLETRDTPSEDRLERRLECMAQLVSRYPQLVEMPAAEYVAIKRREWQEQVERVVGLTEREPS